MNVTSFSHGRTLALIVAGFLLHGAVLGQSLSRANRIFIEFLSTTGHEYFAFGTLPMNFAIELFRRSQIMLQQ